MGLIINSINDDSVNVYLWEIEESIDQLQSMYLERFAEDNFPTCYLDTKLPKRKLHWLICRLILSDIMGSKFELKHDQFGAPYILNCNLNISISHSSAMVCIVTSKFQMVGVDIQKSSEKVVKISPKFLSAHEHTIFNKSQSADYLHACWTGKEAVFKAFKRNLPFKNIVLTNPYPFRSNLLEFRVVRNNKNFVLPVRHHKIGEYFLSYVKL